MLLTLTLKRSSLTLHEGVKVELELVNDGGTDLRLPGPYDLGRALTIEVFQAGGALVRSLDGLTRQAMMSAARIDPRQVRDDLPAGGRWRWELDLASYHHALPAGDYELRARYDVPEKSVRASSAFVPLRVTAARLQQASSLCDAPVLDGLTVLLRGHDGDGPVTVLRQHNAQRPLAAWYSERIDGSARIAWDGPVAPFFAAARFFTTDSFEPTFVKWLLSTDGRTLFAQRLFRGRAMADAIAWALPSGRAVVPSAYYDDDERLTVFLQTPAGTLEAYALDEQGLGPRFTHAVPPTPIPPAIRADCDFIHVLTPWQGALYDRLTLDGQPRERKKPFTTRMTAAACDIDPVRRRGRLLFRDGPRGRALELVAFEPRRHRTDVLHVDGLPLRGSLRELSFDVDDHGRFHLLVATSLRRLYYLRNGRGPLLVGQHEDHFLPLVQAGAGLYLGCHHATEGYRFLQLRQGAYRRRLARLEDMP